MQKFKQFMIGRYGYDRLGLTLLMLALVPLGSGLPFVWIAALLVDGFAVYRMLSRNLAARRRELAKHDAILYRMMMFLRPVIFKVIRLIGFCTKHVKFTIRRFKERHIAVFPKCPACKSRLRLPKGKGLLEATCPSCRHTFRKRT